MTSSVGGRRRRVIVAGAVASLALAACTGGSLSDEAYTYCVNVAPAGELDAAAEALNIAPDADRDFQTNPNRGDPTFQRVCEYAYEARDRDVDAAPPGAPDVGSPSAPLDPQRSQDASPLPPPSSSASSS